MTAKDLNHRRGAKSALVFEAAGNLTECELSFVVKPSTIITDYRVVDKNSTRSGEIEVSYNAEKNNSTLSVKLIEEDTYSLEAGTYFYDLDDLTNSVTLFYGVFLLSADVQTPLDNLEIIPSNCKRAVLLFPAEFEDNTFVYKTTSDGKEQFNPLGIQEAKNILDITELEAGKVDKETGRGLSEINFTSQLKSNYDLSFDEKHIHANKINLDSVNQPLSSTSNVQFNQMGLGRSCLANWSIALNSGLSTKTGTYLDWEGGNARIRENAYNLEFSSYDGVGLVNTFKTGPAGNFSYKPLSTAGLIFKVISVSTNITLTAADHVVLVTTSASDKTVTLPVSGIPDGTVYIIKKTDAGSGRVILQGASGTIDGQASVTIIGENSMLQVIKSGGNYFILGKLV